MLAPPTYHLLFARDPDEGPITMTCSMSGNISEGGTRAKLFATIHEVTEALEAVKISEHRWRRAVEGIVNDFPSFMTITEQEARSLELIEPL
jgi:hypothetical protein